MTETCAVKPTPWPWRFEWCETSICEAVFRVVGADGEIICDNEPYYPHPVSEANARLIAAAPRLLETLEEARQQIEYLHRKFRATGSGNTIIARIDAAIAATTGGAVEVREED